MGKTKKVQSGIPKVKKAKKKRREVVHVVASSAFPISSKSKRQEEAAAAAASTTADKSDAYDARGSTTTNNETRKKLLDWQETAQEIRSLGATAFVKQQKRDYEDEQYERLTGRKRKKHQVPLPIVRGIKKAAEKRLKQQIEEAKQSGTVLPRSLTQKAKKSQQDPTARIHGPAPTVGFMSKGILKVKHP